MKQKFIDANKELNKALYYLSVNAKVLLGLYVLTAVVITIIL